MSRASSLPCATAATASTRITSPRRTGASACAAAKTSCAQKRKRDEPIYDSVVHHLGVLRRWDLLSKRLRWSCRVWSVGRRYLFTRCMNNRKKLDRLFALTQTCHWCGITTRRIVPAHGERSPDDMATFDHLVEGSNVMRKPHIPRPGVLSCCKCNHTRGLEYRKARSEHQRAIRGQIAAIPHGSEPNATRTP